jgi:hypothetical protein
MKQSQRTVGVRGYGPLDGALWRVMKLGTGEDGRRSETFAKASAVIRPHVLVGSARLGTQEYLLALSGRWVDAS